MQSSRTKRGRKRSWASVQVRQLWISTYAYNGQWNYWKLIFFFGSLSGLQTTCYHSSFRGSEVPDESNAEPPDSAGRVWWWVSQEVLLLLGFRALPFSKLKVHSAFLDVPSPFWTIFRAQDCHRSTKNVIFFSRKVCQCPWNIFIDVEMSCHCGVPGSQTSSWRGWLGSSMLEMLASETMLMLVHLFYQQVWRMLQK